MARTGGAPTTHTRAASVTRLIDDARHIHNRFDPERNAMIASLSTTATAATVAAAVATPATPAAGDPFTVTVLTVTCAVLAFIVIAMSVVDLPYFFRTLSAVMWATCFKNRIRVTDTAIYSSLCLTTDLDFYLTHMNNARYLREIDLARIEFALRTGLWQELRRRGGVLFTIANSVRYRKFVRTFSRFEVQTRIVYWDDVSIFFEFRFVSKADGFVRAIVHNRQRVVGCGAEELMRTLIGAKTAEGAYQKPDCPIDIHHWIQSNLMSSASLRAEAGLSGGGSGGDSGGGVGDDDVPEEP